MIYQPTHLPEHFNRDSRILGYYRLARQLAAFVETGVTALAHTVYQDFVELVLQHPAEYLQAQMRRLMKLAGQVAAGLFSVSAALAIPLVPLVFGPAYRPAVPLFQLMLIGVMARLVMFPSSPLHMALGNYKYLMKLNIALAPPALVALALVCWRLGAAGAALTVSLYIVLLNLLGTLRLRRLLQSMIRDGH